MMAFKIKDPGMEKKKKEKVYSYPPDYQEKETQKQKCAVELETFAWMMVLLHVLPDRFHVCADVNSTTALTQREIQVRWCPHHLP